MAANDIPADCDIFGDSQNAKNKDEEKLLLACSTSDLPTIREIVESQNHINFGCVDILGRTPLQLAVENDDIEVTKTLLGRCDAKNVGDCLLLALSLSSENLSLAILKHSRYEEIKMELVNRDNNAFDDTPMQSKFPTNTTPLILAAEKNLYEVVRYLLMKWERIKRPHSLSCTAKCCAQESQKDYFQFAHERLNTYRGLASESYISLSSKDPIKEAFDLRKTLLGLSKFEEHFRSEYLELAKNLSAYTVKLLDGIKGDRELDVVLNKDGDDDEDRCAPLSRLKLAVKLKEKQFVAHPCCQMRLKMLWYEDFEHLGRGHIVKRIAILFGFLCFYVWLALAYILRPKYEYMKFMRSPCAKFASHVWFYLILLAMLFYVTGEDPPYQLEDGITWSQGLNISKYFRMESDGILLFRSDRSHAVHYVIFIWVLGLLWEEILECYRSGWRDHFFSLLNLLDALMITLYIISYILRFVAMVKVQQAATFFRTRYIFVDGDNGTFYNSTDLLEMNYPLAVYYYRWVNPDRYYWDYDDPMILAEGVFAMAVVLEFVRCAAFLPAFEELGTLHISFGAMLKDVFRFLGLFVFVLLAFVVGLANIYWFYEEATRTSVELTPHTATVAEENFGTMILSFKFCFWSLFGMGERDAAEIKQFKHFVFTETIGQILYCSFMVCSVIILLTMLVAMLSLSFSLIHDDADVEWKFSRAELFFDYMLPGATLPVPLNLIPQALTIYRFYEYLSSFRRKRRVIQVKPKHGSTNEDMVGNGRPVNIATISGLEDSTNDKFKYKAVMSRLVWRFISDTTLSKDEDKDDENLKNDLLRIRHEMTRSLETRGREIRESRDDVMSSFHEDLTNCQRAINRLETALTSISTAMVEQKEELLRKINETAAPQLTYQNDQSSAQELSQTSVETVHHNV